MQIFINTQTSRVEHSFEIDRSHDLICGAEIDKVRMIVGDDSTKADRRPIDLLLEEQDRSVCIIDRVRVRLTVVDRQSRSLIVADREIGHREAVWEDAEVGRQCNVDKIGPDFLPLVAIIV